MAADRNFAEVVIHARAEWRDWLAGNHGQGDSIWLVYRKLTRGGVLSVDDAIEEAICWGWIDSLVRRKDEDYAMLLFSPRKAKFAWSAVNKARVEKVLAAGLMQAPGLAKIDEAKRTGRWDALNGVEAMEIPPDLALAFDAHPKSAGNFEAFPRSVKRSILEWILNAKTEATRAKRISETAYLAGRNERANQWKSKT